MTAHAEEPLGSSVGTPVRQEWRTGGVGWGGRVRVAGRGGRPCAPAGGSARRPFPRRRRVHQRHMTYPQQGPRCRDVRLRGPRDPPGNQKTAPHHKNAGRQRPSHCLRRQRRRSSRNCCGLDRRVCRHRLHHRPSCRRCRRLYACPTPYRTSSQNSSTKQTLAAETNGSGAGNGCVVERSGGEQGGLIFSSTAEKWLTKPAADCDGRAAAAVAEGGGGSAPPTRHVTCGVRSRRRRPWRRAGANVRHSHARRVAQKAAPHPGWHRPLKRRRRWCVVAAAER